MSSYLVMPVSMVTDTRLKGLKEILPIGLGIWSDEGGSARKRESSGKAKETVEEKLSQGSCFVCENNWISFLS